MSSFAVLGKGAEGPPGPPGPGLESVDYDVFCSAGVNPCMPPFCAINVKATVSHYGAPQSVEAGHQVYSVGGDDQAHTARSMANMIPPAIEMPRERLAVLLDEYPMTDVYTDHVHVTYAEDWRTAVFPLGPMTVTHEHTDFLADAYCYWMQADFWIHGYASYFEDGALVGYTDPSASAYVNLPGWAYVECGPFGGRLTIACDANGFEIYDTILNTAGTAWDPNADSFDAVRLNSGTLTMGTSWSYVFTAPVTVGKCL